MTIHFLRCIPPLCVISRNKSQHLRDDKLGTCVLLCLLFVKTYVCSLKFEGWGRREDALVSWDIYHNHVLQSFSWRAIFSLVVCVPQIPRLTFSLRLWEGTSVKLVDQIISAVNVKTEAGKKFTWQSSRCQNNYAISVEPSIETPTHMTLRGLSIYCSFFSEKIWSLIECYYVT